MKIMMMDSLYEQHYVEEKIFYSLLKDYEEPLSFGTSKISKMVLHYEATALKMP